MKVNWIKYKTWTGLEAGYSIDEYGKVGVKLFTKVPKKWYYSCLNEAAQYFDEVISITLINNF
jgi:hypothetical protein